MPNSSATPWIVARQTPLSTGFSRQEYQSGLPFPSPGDLPRLGIDSESSTLAGEFFFFFFTTEPPGKPCFLSYIFKNSSLSPSVKINEEKSITVRSEREQPWWKIAFSRPISPRFRFNRHYTSRKAFPGGSEVKASACSAGDPSLIPGSGRSPGEGSGNPLQHSCLENPMDGGV